MVRKGQECIFQISCWLLLATNKSATLQFSVDSSLMMENSALSFHSYHGPELQCGGKQKHTNPHPLTLLHLSVCITHQLTDLLVTGLIDCYRQMGGFKTPTTHEHKRHLYSPAQELPMSKSVYYFFYPEWWVGWAIFNSSLNSVSLLIFGFTVCHIRHSAGFYMSSLQDALRIWIGNVRFSSL